MTFEFAKAERKREPRLVLIDPDLFEAMAEAYAGRKVVVDWGEPTEQRAVYIPTVMAAQPEATTA